MRISARHGWYLYDFGNSILIVNGGLYFPQWLVAGNQVSDAVYNACFILSSILLLTIAPLVGLAADYTKRPFRYLIVSSALLVVAGVGVGLAPFIADRPFRVTIAVISFFFVLVTYQLSLVFYNSLLGYVSDEKDYERVSGRGFAWGWMGGIAGIAFSLPFSRAGQDSSGIYCILPSAVLTAAVMTVSLCLMSRRKNELSEGASILKIQATVKSATVPPNGKSTIWTFLLCYFFFSDAVLTLQNNSTIYMEAVLRMDDRYKAAQFLLVLVTSAIGSLLSEWVARKVGLREALWYVIFAAAFVIFLTPFFTGLVEFSAAVAFMGLLNGCIWSLSRVFFIELIPEGRRNTYFGFYATFERFSTLIGPLTWTVVVSYIDSDPGRYRVAWGTMSSFLFISLWLLGRIKRQQAGNQV
jgi:MFS transporter, UMF1 family